MIRGMPKPNSFRFEALNTGDVKIWHHGKLASTLRGEAATSFLESVKTMNEDAQQQAMARVTGNYKRGNERKAKNHPRNAD